MGTVVCGEIHCKSMAVTKKVTTGTNESIINFFFKKKKQESPPCLVRISKGFEQSFKFYSWPSKIFLGFDFELLILNEMKTAVSVLQFSAVDHLKTA